MIILSSQTIIIIIIISCILYYLHQFFKKKSVEYSSHQYWEGRYGWFTQRMDWYTNFSQLDRDFKINNIIKDKYKKSFQKRKILEMGCGNSTLSYDLYNQGYKNITAIDFSNVVIKQMSNIYKDTNIKYEVCDFNNMKLYFGENIFDIIIEKAGLDSIATKGTKDVPDLLYKIFQNIYAVLSDDGILLSFSSKNTNFWRTNIYERLEKEKMFKVVETKRTIFKTKGNETNMNLYFAYLIKI